MLGRTFSTISNLNQPERKHQMQGQGVPVLMTAVTEEDIQEMQLADNIRPPIN